MNQCGGGRGDYSYKKQKKESSWDMNVSLRALDVLMLAVVCHFASCMAATGNRCKEQRKWHNAVYFLFSSINVHWR